MTPELSSSIMLKSCCRSRRPTSMTRSLCLNSGTASAPRRRSAKVTQPVSPWSILRKMRSRASLSLASSCASSRDRSFRSFSLASANVSTTTATMRFSMPKMSVQSAPTKTTAVHGCVSMRGTATSPQLSEATMIWKRVRFARMTEAKERPQLWQSGHAPWLCSSATSGCSSTTATLAHMVMTRSVRQNDQNSVWRQLANIWISFLSCLKKLSLSNVCRNLSSLLTRRTRNTLASSRPDPIRRTAASAAMDKHSTTASMQCQPLRKARERST
mmetsp:Transcript_123811/g.336239  ORF Transcript_123811/g.336239 Transcript_123811/m.336239 type:complete len:272 (+) Transcript_123811:644-1459(+)